MTARFFLFVLAIASLAVGATPEPGDPGRTLTEVLTDLQNRGLHIVFSSAVVEPTMIVAGQPRTDDPRKMLDEILAPHGLKAEDGPGGTILIVVDPLADTAPSIAGEIRGTVTVGGQPIGTPDMVISVPGTPIQVTPTNIGTFLIPDVPAGTHTVTVTSPGFVPQSIADINVLPGGSQALRFDLVPVSVFLNEVIVTPSHFRLLEDHPEGRQFLDRDEVRKMPHAADDLYRAVKRLPGAAGGDITAKINVRGGEQDELLVILDGVELYEPFHLKDFQSVFSIIDSEAVGGVDFLTGGFPVEYGDRMSGVMDISVVTPTGPPDTALELSTMNARLLTQGLFNQGRGQYFVSGRAWYPDAIVSAFRDSSNEVTTDYYDLLTKVQHQIGRRSTLSANLLSAWDDLGYSSDDEETIEDVRAEYGSFNAWLNLQTNWSESLFSQTVFSGGRISRHRTGRIEDIEDGRLEVDDRRSFEFLGLGQDWVFGLSERNLFKFGFDVVRQDAFYDYLSTTTLRDPDAPTEPLPPITEIAINLEQEGTAYSAYMADRVQISGPLVAEIGLRWDRQTWIGDHQLSPRFNLRYAVGERTTLRAAWGIFYQSQRLYELQIEDGVGHFYPAQRAEHWLLGVEHSFQPGLAGRIEIYRKDLTNQRPRYENLFNPIVLFPESEDDRVLVDPDRGLVRGIDVIFKGSPRPGLSWWASYVLSRAEDEIDGAWQPRSWDQRHAVTAGLNLELGRRWSMSFAGIFHSGWPTTPVTGEVVVGENGELSVEPVVGPRNSANYPAYFRLDTRISKLFPTTSGALTLFLEIINLTNRENVCCTEDFVFTIEPDNGVSVDRELRYWAPIVPTFGIGWRF